MSDNTYTAAPGRYEAVPYRRCGRSGVRIPAGSRMSRSGTSLPEKVLTPGLLEALRGLDAIARRRGQTLAQMSLSWLLVDPRITSVLIGASSLAQLKENLAALENTCFSEEELSAIERLSGPVQITERV